MYLINTLDVFLYDNDLTDQISSLLVNRFSSTGLVAILDSKNIAKLLSSSMIVSQLKIDLTKMVEVENERNDKGETVILDSLHPDQISKLINHEIFSIEDFFTNYKFLESCYNNIDLLDDVLVVKNF